MPRTYSRAIRTLRKPVAVGDGTCRVELTGGFWAIIDEADYGLVAVCNWQVHFGRSLHLPYAKGRLPGSSKWVRMHRHILGAHLGLVDHIDGSTLNNRRSNLRLATRLESDRNKRLYRSNTSGFKGVSQVRHGFTASISVACQSIYLGTYKTATEAAHAYDAAARHYFGAFACTNASLGLLEGVTSQNTVGQVSA
jgi:hypothetical protein